MAKEEAGGAKSQEYYWEQEKQLFAIRRYFYEQNLLPKDDSYFPDDVINVAATLQAENKRLKEEMDEAITLIDEGDEGTAREILFQALAGDNQ